MSGLALFGSLLTSILVGPLVAGGLMIYIGLVTLLHSSLNRLRASLLRQRLLLICLGLLLAAVLTEFGLRIVSRSTPYRILPAGVRLEFHVARGVMPGITGVSVYSTNRDGIRGDQYEPSGRYNILAIGGSTTECRYLDDSKAWPYLLQANLNERNHRLPVWVGNVGRSGLRLADHINALRYFVPQFKIDAIIVMVGINDLIPILRHPVQYSTSAEHWNDPTLVFESSFDKIPLVDDAVSRSLLQKLALWNFIKRVRWNLYIRRFRTDNILVEDQAGINYIRRRQLFHKTPKLIEKLPDLFPALNEYKRNLITLINTAKERKIRLILTTQPVVWSDHLSDRADSLIWMGYYGDRGNPTARYSVKVLAEAMSVFNRKLLNVCRAYNIECVDLASRMSWDERYFYDDAHFNELGASKVAEILADYLKSDGVPDVH